MSTVCPPLAAVFPHGREVERAMCRRNHDVEWSHCVSLLRCNSTGPVRSTEPPGPGLPAFPKPCLVRLSFSILETKLLAFGPSGNKLYPNSTTHFFSCNLFCYLLLPSLSVTITGNYWHIFP